MRGALICVNDLLLDRLVIVDFDMHLKASITGGSRKIRMISAF